MNFVAMGVAGLVVLPAAALVLWVGHSMAEATDQLRNFVVDGGLHFNQ